MTTCIQNKGSNGDMFKIVTEQDILVIGFDIHTNSESNIWVKVLLQKRWIYTYHLTAPWNTALLLQMLVKV